MLSPEERESLQTEAEDERRREVFRRFRRPAPPPTAFLDALTDAVRLLAPHNRRQRKRPPENGTYRL